MSRVSLAKSGFTSRQITNAVYEALEGIGSQISQRIRSALIKVNACFYWDHSTGQTTDLRVVSAIIDYLRDQYGEIDIKIGEADASVMKTKHVFRALNYVSLAREKSVELVNLSSGEILQKEVKVGKQTFSLPFSKQVFETDFLINVPKMKTHILPTLSCSLKNIFGIIAQPYKYQYHPRLEETIVAANKIVRPNLTVVDGIIALSKHPIKLGLVAAGCDPLAVDFVIARIMGYNPLRIGHLSLAAREKVGDFKNIEVIGEGMEVFRSIFPKRNVAFERFSFDSLLCLLRLYARITGDVIPPAIE